MKHIFGIGLLGAIFILLGIAYLEDKTPAPITVGASFCEHSDDNKKCTKWGQPEEQYTVAINPRADTCSIMFEGKAIEFRKAQSFAYIDKENWECRDSPQGAMKSSDKGLQMVYQMQKGNLRIFSEDLDHVVGPVEYHLQNQ